MMGGVQEEAAEFRRDDVFAGLTRYRQFGEFGPPYEVLGVHGDRVAIELIRTGERTEISLAEALENPVAVAA